MRENPAGPIQRKGLSTLVEKLGPTDALCSIPIYDQGYGDYTTERHTWLSDDTDEIITSIYEAKNRI